MELRFSCLLISHATVAIMLITCSAVNAQEQNVNLEELFRRLEQQEKRIHELESRPNDSVDALHSPASLTTRDNVTQRLDALEEAFSQNATGAIYGQAEEGRESPSYYSDYDGGFRIRPRDENANSFGLKINGRMQFRYTNFTSDTSSYTNLAGTIPWQNRNEFEIERARLMFSGFMYDPNLQFFINIDADTDDNHRAVFHDFWMNYKFSDAFNLHWGKAFVPGTRAWLEGSTRTHLMNRSMASSFFRPDRSLGVWASGNFREELFYRAMISEGFNTTDLEYIGSTRFEKDDNLFYSGSMWWEPLGEFGKGYADLEHHANSVIRIGHTFMYGQQEPQDTGVITREQRALRLSDGSRLTDVGVTEYDLVGYAVDFAWKYRGLSVNAEVYFRWLKDIQSAGVFTDTEVYQDGFYVDAGYMLLHKRLEVVGRMSQVDGIYKDSWEYAAGINWYLNGTHKNKITFDVAVFDGVPTGTNGADLEVGMDGILYRMQYQLAF